MIMGLDVRIFQWVLEERLPFFFQSPIYVEYQLCKLLTSALLFDESKSYLTKLQKSALESMMKMYQFRLWLKTVSPIGILLFVYWLDAQAALVVHYQGDDDTAKFLLIELKEKYYEKHS